MGKEVLDAARRAGFYGGIAVGAGSLVLNETTGVNPLAITPDPLSAMMYGGMTFNPIKALRLIGRGIGPEKGLRKTFAPKLSKNLTPSPVATRYMGMVGYKTLALGVPAKGAGLLTRLSIGNVALSSIQGASRLASRLVGEELSQAAIFQVGNNLRNIGFGGAVEALEDIVPGRCSCR